jgi:hypothetical protein
MAWKSICHFDHIVDSRDLDEQASIEGLIIQAMLKERLTTQFGEWAISEWRIG